MVPETIEKLILGALKELDLPDDLSAGVHAQAGKIALEHPADISHGDYSTNIALVLAKKLKEKPRDVADRIVGKLKVESLKFVEKVEVAGAGFFNFYLLAYFLFHPRIYQIMHIAP